MLSHCQMRCTGGSRVEVSDLHRSCDLHKCTMQGCAENSSLVRKNAKVTLKGCESSFNGGRGHDKHAGFAVHQGGTATMTGCKSQGDYRCCYVNAGTLSC